MRSSFDDQLRAQLVAAAQRRIARRPRRRWATLGLGVAGVVAAVVGLQPAPAGAGVEIRVRGGVLEVRLTDLESRPDVIDEALTEAGLDVSIEAVPVGPSNVGRFVGNAGAAVPELRTVDERGGTFAGFAIPADFDGRLELFVGRPASPGEDYQAFSDAYAPGEPLSCLGAYGRTAAEVAELGADHGVELRFEPFSAEGAPLAPAVDATEIAGSPYAGWVAIDAQSLRPGSASVIVTEDGTADFLNPISPDRGACRE